jgi:CheY-like chemotaxis protein
VTARPKLTDIEAGIGWALPTTRLRAITRNRNRNNDMLWRLTDPATATCEPPGKEAACELLPRAPGATLVVDSNDEVAATIAAALRECGWHVQTVRTIAEARLQLPTLKPCIVLLDMWQSDGSGIAFVREQAGRSVGIIVVSAFNDLADRVVGLELGADDYITKPFALHELMARARALDRRMARQHARRSPVS